MTKEELKRPWVAWHMIGDKCWASRCFADLRQAIKFIEKRNQDDFIGMPSAYLTYRGNPKNL